MNVTAIGRCVGNATRSFVRTTRNVAAATVIAATPVTKAVAKTEGGAIFNSATLSAASSSFTNTTINSSSTILPTILIKADRELTGSFTNEVSKVCLIMEQKGNPINYKLTGLTKTTSGWKIDIEALTDMGAKVKTTTTIPEEKCYFPTCFFKSEIKNPHIPSSSQGK